MGTQTFTGGALAWHQVQRTMSGNGMSLDTSRLLPPERQKQQHGPQRNPNQPKPKKQPPIVVGVRCVDFHSDALH